MEENIYNTRFPVELREHIDMVAPIRGTNRIRPMNEIDLNEEKITKCLKNFKEKKAAGPDRLKSELYKILANNKKSKKILTKCMKKEIKSKRKPENWKKAKRECCNLKGKETINK